MQKKIINSFFLVNALLLSGCNNVNNESSANNLYDLILPSIEGCSISSSKNQYKANELVQLDIKIEDKYYIEDKSLKYNGIVIDDTYSFYMPSEDAIITASVYKDDLPENQIYGARFHSNESALWSMAFIDVNNVALENVSSVVVEVRFNEIIDNFWFRLCCSTSTNDVYDAFAKDFSSNYMYSCDMDHPNAVSLLNWATAAYEGWVPTWNTNIDEVPPTFFVEVPLTAMFARFNFYKTLTVAEGSALSNTKTLAKLGIHITGPASKVDFTIGRLFVRRNGILSPIATCENYTKDKQDGKNYVSALKVDNYGTYKSNLEIDVYSNYKKHKNNMLMLGDSIMTRWWSNDQVARIASSVDANLIRDTIGGTTIVSTNNLSSNDNSLIYQKENGIFDKYIEELKQLDYIIIQRGTNDLWRINHNDYKLGDTNSNDNKTVMGALKELLLYFKEKCPRAKIIVSTILYRHDEIKDSLVLEYNEALKELANYIGGINVFDLYNLSGINSENYEMYLNTSTNPHHNGSLADNLHPNDAGAKLIGDAWVNYLKTI